MDTNRTLSEVRFGFHLAALTSVRRACGIAGSFWSFQKQQQQAFHKNEVTE